jgi:transcription antitermination protein NusB
VTTSIEGRRRAREAAFQVAFQADLMGESFLETWARLKENVRLSDDQRQLVDDVVSTLERQRETVDGALRSAAEHWEIERLAATDRSVLRASVAELLGRPGTPVRVILNEAIEIAKRYGSEESGRFVNGVLDRVARSLRPQEM